MPGVKLCEVCRERPATAFIRQTRGKPGMETYHERVVFHCAECTERLHRLASDVTAPRRGDSKKKAMMEQLSFL